MGPKSPYLKLRESSSPEIEFLAQYVYEKIFLNYNSKHWGLTPEDLDPSVTARVPVSITRDDRYFQDTYQGIPRHGYTAMFRKMLDHPNIRLLLNTRFSEIRDQVSFERMIYTGSIDEFFDCKHGALPYRSVRFDFQHHPIEWYQEAGTVNYPNDHAFTRIEEQKWLTGQRIPGTTVIVDYPEAHVPGRNEAYYPVPRPENRARYDLYARDARELGGQVSFAGRLGDYQYYNMDQAVARALDLFEREAL